jgi:ribonucleoside-triphosphate reductase (thioredoxin)
MQRISALENRIMDFELSDKFLENYKGKQPNWGPLGYVTYKRTYSRPTKFDENHKPIETEEFWETLKRVIDGVYTLQKQHCKRLKLPWNNAKSQKSAQEMFRLMWDMKFLPPGRGLWMMGTDYVFYRGSAALNNCGFVSTKDIKYDFSGPFAWLMDFSMLGVGVGFDTKGTGTVKIQKPEVSNEIHTVEDSREGWVDLIKRVLDSYVGKGTFPTNVDYSLLRPAGAPLKGFGGTSSGPGPLIELVDNIKELLDKSIDKLIDTAAIVDISNLIGRCVVSGNIRRSAQIAFADAEDSLFLDLKNPELHQKELYHHRWASNNSVYVKENSDYIELAKRTALNGEPGYVWLENCKNYGRMGRAPDYSDLRVEGSNPCAEITLEPYELCNLVEVFAPNHDSWEDFRHTLKYAYLYAKSVTLLPSHDERTNNVMLRNRRIGTSISGIVQGMNKVGKRNFLEWCDKGYGYLRDLDRIYSEWLCIPRSIKVSTVKPSGSVSLLPGVTPGIHYPHSEYYIRRIRFQEGSDLLKLIQEAGYPVEKDKYSPNTVVASFPVREPFYTKGKNDVTIWEQMEMTAQMQQYWADNSVSVTVTFKKAEEKDIKSCLELYSTRLKTVSFLPIAEHGYEQAPYEEIDKDIYDRLMKDVFPLNLSSSTDSKGDEKVYCESDRCYIAGDVEPTKESS